MGISKDGAGWKGGTEKREGQRKREEKRRTCRQCAIRNIGG
jgi:hypothetical protein